jgi:hypothetical protein
VNAQASALLKRARVNLGEALEAEASPADVVAVALAAVRRDRLPSATDVDDAREWLTYLGVVQ